MRPITLFSLAVGILSLIAAAGCGSGGSVVLPNPTGTYSLASLNGSFVYQIRGLSTVGAYREIGLFTADGAGHITGGSDDFSNGGLISNTITGNYQVGNDGTGFLSIGPTALGQITFAITLASSSKVYLMEADNFADGAGVAELQSSARAPTGTFVFRLHQIAAGLGVNPVSKVGTLTLAAGNVTAGNLDQNSGGTSSQLTLISGTFNAPNLQGRGLASVTDSTNAVSNFVFYVVDGGKLALLESNSGIVASGSAEAQSGAVGSGLSGSYAFGSRGDFGINYDAAATVGQFTASGGAITAYTSDAMQLGTYSNPSYTGTYTAQTNGRVAVSLNSGGVQEVFWMVNPARAFFLVNDPSRVEDGTADLQTVGSFTASTLKGQYAMVMDGIDFFNNQILARVGIAQYDGSIKAVVSELVNASNSGLGAQSPIGGPPTGAYAVSTNGRGIATLTNATGPLTVVTYSISGSDAYALQVDGFTNTSGTIELQH